MISNIPNLSNIPWHKKSFDTIAKELNNSSADMRLLVPMFGKGKSTVALAMMDSGDAWIMGNWKQINNKIRTANDLRVTLPNSSNAKCHRIVGKLRWLGLRKDGRNIVDEKGFVPEETYYLDKSTGKTGTILKQDLNPPRQSFYNQIGKSRIKKEIEAYGIEVFWKYYSDQDIIDMYKEHVDPDLLLNVKAFTTTNMIPFLTDRNLVKEIIIDEGVEGEPVEFNSLRNRKHSISGILGSTGGSKIGLKLTTNSSDDIEDFLKDMEKVVDKFYDHVESQVADFVFEGKGFIHADFDTVTAPEINGLMQDWEKKISREMEREMYQKNNIRKISDIYESKKVINWFYKNWKYSENVKIWRDGKTIQSAEGNYLLYNNVIDWCSRYPHKTVTIIQTVANRRLPKIYEKKYSYQNRGIGNTGLDLDVLDCGMAIEDSVQRKFDRYSWNGGSLTKQDMESSLFQDGFIPIIDKLGELEETGVILPNSNLDRSKEDIIYPDEFDNAVSGNFQIDGTNQFKDVKYHFVCSQFRINPDQIWDPLISWYEEPKKIEDIRDYIKTNNNGEQIGYKDPDIEWKGNYPDDYNLLDRLWEDISVKNTVEKFFRKRNVFKGHSIRVGNAIKYRGKEFTQNKGDRVELFTFLIESLYEEGMSILEISEFLAGLSLNTHATRLLKKSIENADIELPLEMKKKSGDSRYLSVNKKEIFESVALDLGWEWKTKAWGTREVNVSEISEESGIDRRTINQWIQDEDDILNMFTVRKGGRGRGNHTTVEPIKDSNIMMEKVDSDNIEGRNENDSSSGRFEPDNPF